MMPIALSLYAIGFFYAWSEVVGHPHGDGVVAVVLAIFWPFVAVFLMVVDVVEHWLYPDR